MAAGAQEGANFFLGALHPGGARRLHVDREALLLAIDFEISLDGNVGETILRLSQHGAHGLGYAHDLKGTTINHDFTAQRINVGKKFVSDIGADHSDAGVVFVVEIGDVAARGRLLHIHIADVGGNATHVHVLHVLLAVAQLAENANFHTYRFGQLEPIAHGFKIVPGDFFIPPPGFDELLGVGDQRELMHQKNIAAHVGHGIGDVLVGAFDERHHDDQSRHRQNNAQQHEERAQLVGAHGLQRHHSGFAQQHTARLHRSMN